MIGKGYGTQARGQCTSDHGFRGEIPIGGC
jgi:hypothetical protein